MSCYTFYVGENDNTISLDGLTNPETGDFVNDAVVEVTLYESDGETELDGIVWPLTLDYVLGSDGNYSASFDASLLTDVVDGTSGKLELTAQSGALNAEWTLDYKFETRDNSALYLTSKNELEQMFGRTNVQTWADLENEGDTEEIALRIQWAVNEATAEARTLLLGSVALEGCSSDSMLRMATTRLAGVLLYESRGVKDTADEEGRHRLKWHRDRARLYFQQVQSGQIRVRGENTVSSPAAVKTCPSTARRYCYGPEDLGLGIPDSA